MGSAVGLSRSRGRGFPVAEVIATSGVLAGFFWDRLDLDEGIGTLIGCYRKTETPAQLWRDAVVGPARLIEKLHLRAADGGEGREAVLDDGDDLGFAVGAWVRWYEPDVDAIAGRHAGDTRARRIRVVQERDGVHEAELDDVGADFGVVAVAQCGENVGFGERSDGGAAHGAELIIRLVLFGDLGRIAG